MSLFTRVFLKQVVPASLDWSTFVSMSKIGEQALLSSVSTSAFLLYQRDDSVIGAAEVEITKLSFTVSQLVIKPRYQYSEHESHMWRLIDDFAKCEHAKKVPQKTEVGGESSEREKLQ